MVTNADILNRMTDSSELRLLDVRDSQVPGMRKPIQVVGFSDEEGVRWVLN